MLLRLPLRLKNSSLALDMPEVINVRPNAPEEFKLIHITSSIFAILDVSIDVAHARIVQHSLVRGHSAKLPLLFTHM